MSCLTGRTVAVTGGAGFIGSHVVEGLLDRGVGAVRVLDDLSAGSLQNLETALEDRRVTLVEIDLAEAKPTLAALEGVDAVVHLAAVKHNREAGSAQRVVRVNCQATVNVLEGALAGGARRFLFASSLYVYGVERKRPLSEADPVEPHTLYGATKVAGEAMCRAYRVGRGLDARVARYFFVYGPRLYQGAYSDSLVAGNSRRIRAGERPTIYGEGDQQLDWIYVDDAVRATLAILEDDDSAGEIYNVGTGRGTSVLEVCRILADLLGRPFDPLHCDADETAGTLRVADVSKIERKLSIRPEVSIVEGLRRVVESGE